LRTTANWVIPPATTLVTMKETSQIRIAIPIAAPRAAKRAFTSTGAVGSVGIRGVIRFVR